MATALTWRIPLTPTSTPNLDASWTAGLFLAAKHGIHFGPDLAFVYGPLGFLSRPVLYYSGPAALAIVASGIAYFTALALVARLLWSRLGPVWGTLLTLLAASATSWLDGPERVEAIFVLLVLGTILDDRLELTPRRAALLGALTALMGLVKLSSGAVMLAMLVVMAAFPLLRRRPRRESATVAATALGSPVVAGVFLWLVSGQSLWDIPRYLRNGREAITGNPDNVSIEVAGLGGDYVLAAVATAALALAAAIALRPLRRANQVAGALLLALYAWIAFRHGFTRHDTGHVVLFFSPLLLILAALVPEIGPRRPLGRTGAVQGLAAAVAAATLIAGGLAEHSFSDLFLFSTDSVVDTAKTMLSAHNRGVVREGARKGLEAGLALPPSMLRRVSGQTVHIDPWEASTAWAYQAIRWRPVPLFQSYTAYTSALDDLDADFLAKDKAPRYVLRRNETVDERNARFESPRYVEELICRYRQVSAAPGWMLLERGPDRCGRPVQLESKRVRLGQTVPVPKAGRDDMVVARFGDFSESAFESLKGLVWKRSPLYIQLGPGRINRFLPGHADNPHVLKPPVCLGWDPGIFDPAPYPSVDIAHKDRLDKPEGSGDYELRVYRVPFRCPDSLRQR